MVELTLQWRIKKTRKKTNEGVLEYDSYYISVPFSYAMFLLEYEPYLDPINKVIIFKTKQQNNTKTSILIKLRWRIKKTRKKIKEGEKEYPVSYINISRRTALFLLEYEPVLDTTNNVIIFKPKQNDTQQSSTQNQPQSQ
jgi:hypothetical protein